MPLLSPYYNISAYESKQDWKHEGSDLTNITFPLFYSVLDNVSFECLKDIIFQWFLCTNLEISNLCFDLGWKKTLKTSISGETWILSFDKL